MDPPPLPFPPGDPKFVMHLLVGVLVSLSASALGCFGINLQAHALRGESAAVAASEIRSRNASRNASRRESRNRSQSTSEGQDTQQILLPQTQNQPRTPQTQVRPPKLKSLCATLYRRRWLVGFSLYIASQVFGSAVALQFLPTLLVAPLSSASLFFNALFSRLLLGSRIRVLDILGTGLVVSGAVLVSVFGSRTSAQFQPLSELIATFSRPMFIIYFSSQMLLIAAISLGVASLARNHRTCHLPAPRDPRVPLVLACLHSVLGGVMASQSILLAKAVIALATRAPASFLHPLPPFMLLLLIQSVLAQLYTLTCSLYYAPTRTVLTVPVFNTVYNCVALVNSMVYWDEFSFWADNPAKLVAIVGGVVLNILGVVCLSFGARFRSSSSDPDSDEEAQGLLENDWSSILVVDDASLDYPDHLIQRLDDSLDHPNLLNPTHASTGHLDHQNHNHTSSPQPPTPTESESSHVSANLNQTLLRSRSSPPEFPVQKPFGNQP